MVNLSAEKGVKKSSLFFIISIIGIVISTISGVFSYLWHDSNMYIDTLLDNKSLNSGISGIVDGSFKILIIITVVMLIVGIVFKIKEKGDIISAKYTLDENINNLSKEGINIEIAAVVDVRPMGMNSLYSGDGTIIVSDEFMDNYKGHIQDYIIMYIDSSNADKLQDDIDEFLKDETEYNLDNLSQTMRNMKSMFLLISIFLYGFIAVIALIGITSIFNTITTSMDLRSKEFAMLKSVGMTKKEFNKMIRLESVFYGTKSLLIGLPIGIGLSYLIFKALSSRVEFTYILPVNGVIISIIAVFLLVWSIMKFSLSKINKQNIIETIRRDNI